MGEIRDEGCNTLPTSPARGCDPEIDSASVSSSRGLRPGAVSPTDIPTWCNTGRRESETLKRIMVLGPTGAGKSTLINMITGSAFNASNRLASCTQEFAVTHEFQFENTWIELIDTPGFNDSVRSEIEILGEIARGLSQLSAAKKPLHGVIYLHKISDYRMSGSARRNFQTFLDMCGEWAMPHVVILTNGWDLVTPEVGEARHHELGTSPELFKPARDYGALLVPNNRPPGSANEAIRKLIKNPPVELALQIELSQGTPLIRTKAGARINREMAQKSAEHAAAISRLNEEYEAAQQRRDTEAQEEIAQERESRLKTLQELQSVANRLREQAQRQAISTDPASYSGRDDGRAISHRGKRVAGASQLHSGTKLGNGLVEAAKDKAKETWKMVWDTGVGVVTLFSPDLGEPRKTEPQRHKGHR